MPETDPISTDNTALGGILQQQMPGMLAGNKTLQEKVQALPNTLKKIEAEGTAKEQPYQDKLDKLTADQMRIYQGKPPQTEPTSLIEEWGSPAMLFAIFGSMFTRMPMTSALNAAAAVNKAYQQRDPGHLYALAEDICDDRGRDSRQGGNPQEIADAQRYVRLCQHLL